MVSWATVTFSSNQLIPFPTAVAAPYSSTSLKVHSPRRGKFDFLFAENHPRASTSVGGSNRVSSLQTQQVTWEDPDDGSGSEYDEEDKEVDENDLDYESDWEEERNASATTSVDEPTTGVDETTTYKYEECLPEGHTLLEPFIHSPLL